MKLYHATHIRATRSILTKGLLTRYATGKLPAVWLASKARIPWACGHTVLRHGGRIEDVVVFEVTLPRRMLRRYARGLWYCLANVDPAAIRCHAAFRQVYMSEVTQ